MVAPIERDDLAEDLVGIAGEEAEGAGDEAHLGAGFAHDLAIVGRFERAHALGIAFQQVRQAVHQPAAFQPGRLAPVALEAVARGGHGGRDVAFACLRDRGPGLLIEGIQGLKALTRCRCNPFAVDIEIVIARRRRQINSPMVFRFA